MGRKGKKGEGKREVGRSHYCPSVHISNSLPNDLCTNLLRGRGMGGVSVCPPVLDLGGIMDDTEEGGRRVRY